MNELLDALGYVGSALDKPGRAVRGLLGGRPEEAAAVVPFSDSLGLTDPSRAVSGTDLMRQAGLNTGSEWGNALLGFGTEVALDPTTYLGGFMGRLGGKALGRGMEAAARMRGPGYSTGLDDILRMVGGSEKGQAVAHWLSSANPKVFGEVPPASRFLGAGEEAAAFGTPAGDVVRLGMQKPDQAGRPIADSVLQATRSAGYGGDGGFSAVAERLPMAGQVADLPYWLKGSGQPGLTRMGAMKQQAAGEGLRFHDVHAGNLGVVDGRPKIIDPGAVSPSGFAGEFQKADAAAEPGLLMRTLLDAAGGQRAMQDALASGFSAPKWSSSYGRTGLGLGAAAPSLFRNPQPGSLP